MPASRARKLSQLMSEGGSLDTQIDSGGTTSEIGGGSVTVYADMTTLIAVTGMSNGDQAFVTANNNLYIYSGTGWYKIATVQNDSPTAITGVSGGYSLAIDGTPTVITAVSTDPEGFPLTWTYSTSGLGSIATVSQADNVFTVTPSTDVANVGTFTLTINATDGVNGAVSANTSITLQFQILNSKYTTLLATVTGTGDNNDITDSSTNNHTITVNGQAYASTFSPYRHGGYSGSFDGNGSYLNLGSSSSLNFTGSTFTLEAWVYVTNLSIDRVITSQDDAYNSAMLHQFKINASGQVVFVYWTDASRASAVGFTSTSSININQWHHIALSYDGSTLYCFIDGIAAGTASIPTMYAGSKPFVIGGFHNANVLQNWIGNIADLRLVKGTALYTSDFTPPTERLTAISGTSLLMFNKAAAFKDVSTNNHTHTKNGSPAIEPRGPFDNFEYSKTSHGGSIYLDGSDYLSISATATDLLAETTDTTIEAWVITTTEGFDAIFSNFDPSSPYNGMEVGINNGHQHFYSNGTWVNNPIGTGVSTINDGQWHHLAWVITNSGTTVTTYVDGVQNYTSSINASTTGGSNIRIGASSNSPVNREFPGYISDFRFVKGTAVYTGAFTPPTQPLSAIANTALLVSGTDASVIDKAQIHNLNLVGGTTGSTTQVKFNGTLSMYFDGTDDEIVIPASPLLDFSIEDFTIELWFRYASAVPTGSEYNYLWGINGITSNGLGLFVQNEKPGLYNSGYLIQQNTTVSTGQWYHIATVREGNTLTLYLDGNSIGSTTYTADLSGGASNGMSIGRWGSSANDPRYFDGYIQDLRITKGLARYTANFTPPTEPLKG